MMKIEINFDDVQTLLVGFAKDHGMSEEQVHEEWLLCYRTPLQSEVESRLHNLLEAMQLYKEAMAGGDGVTARCGLLYAGLAAGHLSSSFDALDKDLINAMRLDPTVIPENYKIPEHYGFSQR